MICDKDLKKIKSNSLFSDVDNETLNKLEEHFGAGICTYTAGEVIHSPALAQKSAGFLLSGKAVVTTADEGKSTLLRFLSAGELFGIASLFSDSSHVSIIRAEACCRVWVIPEAAIKYLLEFNPAFLYQYITFLTDRIRYLNAKIGYLTAGSAERRLALYLLSLGKTTVSLNASISALSELLDVGRASLYRAFDKLTEDGYIRKEGREFTLLDPGGMLDAYH